MKCLLCEAPIDDHWDYCTACYQKTIFELEREMEKREGPSVPAKESREAPASETRKENAHHC